MPDYIIRVIPKYKPITNHPFTGDRDDARQLARDMAEEAFPNATIKGSPRSSDAFVARHGTRYAGTVAVEIAEED